MCLLYLLKSDFGEDVQANFKSDEIPFQFIFCILGIVKSDLDEGAFDILRSEWPWELIISLLYVLKHDFGEVEEAKFQGVESPCELIFLSLESNRATWT
jgi:hypothetical protein